MPPMIVLAAVYQPGPQLTKSVNELLQVMPPDTSVVIVDDGSGPAYRKAFDEVERLGCTVLRQGTNRGKGAALKVGLRHVGARDVVCADPDGQHKPDDVVLVADRLRDTGRIVLGVRRFEGDVPLRSRVGNTITCDLFRAATGRAIRDTQTGLRGFPAALVPWLTRVPGERYDYEMNVLLRAAARGLPIEQVDIETEYLNDNEGSHFGSIADSARIYRPLVRRALITLLAGPIRT